MSAHPYTEDQLVEHRAIGLFGEIGWQTVSALEEVFGEGGTLGRETPGEVVLVSRLRAALRLLNPALPAEAITAAEDELTRDRSAMLPEQAKREVYLLLKEGVKVFMPDRERGGQKTERPRVIDWQDPTANDFLAVRQISFAGPLYTCRRDIVRFVNGLPLVVLEFKKPGDSAQEAFDENITSSSLPKMEFRSCSFLSHCSLPLMASTAASGCYSAFGGQAFLRSNF